MSDDFYESRVAMAAVKADRELRHGGGLLTFEDVFGPCRPHIIHVAPDHGVPPAKHNGLTFHEYLEKYAEYEKRCGSIKFKCGPAECPNGHTKTTR